MGTKHTTRIKIKGFLASWAVILLVSCLAQTAQASLPANPQLPKSYAVFMAAYEPSTHKALGGVAGTAFFTAKSVAVTAFHVLNNQSFKVPAGFKTMSIWLVHEGEPAIKVEQRFLEEDQNHDLTKIRFNSAVAKSEFIYDLKRSVQVTKGMAVSTDGFRANSVGPELKDANGSLQVVQTLKLERVHATGEVLATVNYSVHATDVTHEQSPCLQMSFQPVVGISGGPVISDGHVIGVNSFADPSTRQTTWALDAHAI